MKLVWVVIPLILFGVVGMQESYAEEKIIITMVPNASYPPTCDPSIPPYDKPNCFLPAIVNVDVGQSVIFKNSKPSITVIASGNPQQGLDGIFESPPIPSGSSYEVSFDKEGTYTYFDLVAPWMAGTIIVGTSTDNLPPVVNAGQDRIVVEGKFVHLYMIVDDPENKKLRYNWKQVSGSTVKLSTGNFPKGDVSSDFPYLSTASKTTSFIAPNVYATTSFVFEATVIDNALQRTMDTVQITVIDDVQSKDYPTYTGKGRYG
jgi:plastocyanin